MQAGQFSVECYGSSSHCGTTSSLWLILIVVSVSIQFVPSQI
jgi:hypothetical protein